jgi:hypothetical protein
MYVEPLHTKIEKQIETYLGDIVMESHAGFPWSESNIYLVGRDGKIVWRAVKPDPNTLFSKVKLNEDGVTFSAYTIGGHACDLELKTGNLISQTKIQ